MAKERMLCIGGSMNGKYVEIDPGQPDYRAFPKTDDLSAIDLGDPPPASFAYEVYVRRQFFGSDGMYYWIDKDFKHYFKQALVLDLMPIAEMKRLKIPHQYFPD